MNRWKSIGIAIVFFGMGAIACWAAMALTVGNVWWWSILSACAAKERQNSAFAQAVIENDLHEAKTALSNGADPNAMYHLNDWILDRLLYWPPKPEGTAWGQRLGEIAVYSEFPQMTQLLIDAGYDPVWSSDEVNTLQLALAKNNDEIVGILLKSGINPNLSNKNGSTPLMLASALGQVDIIETLLENGAAPCARNTGSSDIEGYAWITPIFYAVLGSKHAAELQGNQTEAIRTLVRYGAKINDIAKDGSTPLHVAVTKKNTEVVALLLELGANADATDDVGRTAYDLAVELGNTDVMALL